MSTSLSQHAFVEVATWMGAAPLLAVVWRRMPARYQWVAAGLAVSCVADNLDRIVDTWMLGGVYPLSQSVFVAIPLTSRREAALFVVALLAVGLWSIALTGGHGPDFALRIVGWGSIVVLAVTRLPRSALRTAVVVYFAGSLLTWLPFAWYKTWPTLIAYQGARAVGIGWFLWAARQARERQVACPTVR